MTEDESKKLLDLANNWEEAAKTFFRSMRRHRSLADYWQNKGDFRQAELLMGLAAADEIRANMMKGFAEKLALTIGQLQEKGAAVPVPAGRRKRVKQYA